MTQRRVLIGTPCHDGKNEYAYTHAYGETIRLGCSLGVDVRGLGILYDAIVQNARNDIVKASLDFKFDDLIFIDSDEGWEPKCVFRLLKHDVDCVGFPVRKKEDQESYNVRADDPNIPVDPKAGLMVVKGLGTGFIRFSKRALQAIWDRSEDYTDRGKQTRWMFDIRPVNGRLVGEDIMIASKLADAGIPIYLDPTYTISHIGTKRWDGNFLAYLKRLQNETSARYDTFDGKKIIEEVAMGG